MYSLLCSSLNPIAGEPVKLAAVISWITGEGNGGEENHQVMINMARTLPLI